MARDRIESSRYKEFKLRLIGSRNSDGRRYNLPTVFEVAGLIISDIDPEEKYRDIVIETQSETLQRINELHLSYIPLQYPLLLSLW